MNTLSCICTKKDLIGPVLKFSWIKWWWGCAFIHQSIHSHQIVWIGHYHLQTKTIHPGKQAMYTCLPYMDGISYISFGTPPGKPVNLFLRIQWEFQYSTNSLSSCWRDGKLTKIRQYLGGRWNVVDSIYTP